MTRHPDPLFNLADALSEDIVAAPADELLHEAESDPGGRAGLVASFDRIAARAVAQSRRRRIVERLRGMLQVWPVPLGLTSAMVGVAGVCAVGIVGGTYFYQAESYRQAAAVPPRVLADRSAAKTSAPTAGTPMSYAESRAARLDPDSQSDRIARSDNAATPVTPAAVAAAPPPAPTAAPPVATQAPPPAPPVAAGAADEPKPVRTVEIQPGMAATPLVRSARRPLDRPAARAEDRVAALVAAAEQKQLSPGPVSRATALAPEPPKVASPPTLAIAAADSPRFQWPARGRVIAAFGSVVGGVANNGIDLAVPAGTDVVAAEEGVVLYTGNEIKGLGNLILLRHRNDFVTAYAHAKSIQVRVGDTVRRGQVIAKSGQTGAVKAPQLHFEIRRENAPIDPAQHLPPG